MMDVANELVHAVLRDTWQRTSCSYYYMCRANQETISGPNTLLQFRLFLFVRIFRMWWTSNSRQKCRILIFLLSTCNNLATDALTFHLLNAAINDHITSNTTFFADLILTALHFLHFVPSLTPQMGAYCWLQLVSNHIKGGRRSLKIQTCPIVRLIIIGAACFDSIPDVLNVSFDTHLNFGKYPTGSVCGILLKRAAAGNYFQIS